eukprot:gene5309-5978_t
MYVIFYRFHCQVDSIISLILLASFCAASLSSKQQEQSRAAITEKAFHKMMKNKASGDVLSSSASIPISTCDPISVRTLKRAYSKQNDAANLEFVAATREEAALFPDQHWDSKKKEKYLQIVKTLKQRILKWAGGNLSRIIDFRRLLERKLGVPPGSYSRTFASTSQNEEKRSVSTVRSCYDSGSVDQSTGNIRICPSCSAQTVLPENWYPRYVNEVICKPQDRVVFQGEARCAEKHFLITFLYNTGRCIPVTHNGQTVHIEEWISSQRRVGTACECQITPGSFLISIL